MFMTNIDVFNTLYPIALNLTPTFRTRHAACIVYKNEFISFGVNSNKTHPFQSRFSKHPNSIYLHAEIDAIKNARLYKNLSKCNLYVCRIKWDDKEEHIVFGNSKPCLGCVKAILQFNIKQVIYTDESSSKILCSNLFSNVTN